MSTGRKRSVFSLGKFRFPVVGPASSSQQQQLLDSGGCSGGGGGGGGGGSGSGKAVKYTPCSRQEAELDNELEEIAVVSVSGVESGQLTYGTGTYMVNGPRVIPGKSASCTSRSSSG